MRQILVLIIALINIHSLVSQNQDTLYLDSSFKEITKDSAVYHRVLNKFKDDNTKYVLTDFYSHGEIFSTSNYLSKTNATVTLKNYMMFEKKNKFLKHGKSVLYYKNGNVRESRNYLNGKQEGSVVQYEENPVFIIVENMPQFPGGDDELYKYIAQTIKYPLEAYEQKIYGRVYVNFIIDFNGKVKDAKIIRGVHALLDEEALRVVNAMPNWQPGSQRGKPVNVYYNVPVSFVIQESPEN